jgi:hypothetical protein
VRTSRVTPLEEVTLQGANALISATVRFLRRNHIPRKLILDSISQNYAPKRSASKLRQYRRDIRSYEQMGMVMATWFSLPRFLDRESRPIPLTLQPGRKSVAALVKASRVSIKPATATELMRRSLSVKFDGSKSVSAIRPEFVLPNFEVPRAALVMERYLDTLSRNSSPKRGQTILLLERNCHVPEIDLRTITPILRDIKGRGSAFIKAVDGHIEGNRARSAASTQVGEMSVHIFAWTKPSRGRKLSSLKLATPGKRGPAQ